MPTHTVKEGEHLGRIASDYGFVDPDSIWNHSENAALKQQRKNPNVLLAGDKLFIPEKELREEQGATEKRHRFKCLIKKLKLRLKLLDFDNQPLANLKCQLHVEGHTLELTTDSDGIIERQIPETAQSGLLTYKEPSSGQDIGVPIKIGHLDPIDELTGQKGRLNNLGYNAGKLGEPADEQFKIAVQEFQCDFGITVDGICGSGTQTKLKEVHGC